MKKSNATATALLTFAAWIAAPMTAANAATTVYRDVGSFLAAVGPKVEVVTFNGAPPADLFPTMGWNYFSDGLLVGSCEKPGPGSCGSGDYNYYAAWSNGAIRTFPGHEPPGSAFTALIFQFDVPTRAVGFDLGGETDVVVSLFDRGIFQEYAGGVSPAGATGFFGLVTDIAFGSLQIGRAGAIDRFQESFYVDNLYITTAVPEPATASLAGLGLLGLGMYRRLTNGRRLRKA